MWWPAALVGMELRGMVWIGLVNSGYSRKGETISDRHPGGAEQHDPGQGTGTELTIKGLGVGCSAEGY